MSPPHIEIRIGDTVGIELWSHVARLADRLPGDWVLIGGLMVQLHALERGATDVRVTRDIDVLAEARPPGALLRVVEALLADGFVAEAPDRDGYAHRFVRDDVVVDVLAPDGLTPPPTLHGSRKAIGVPGGSQALSRAEDVVVRVDGRSFALRRPTLLGAILIKSRSLMVHADPAAQREDLLRLLALVEDPRDLAADLKPTERRWLRNAEGRLDFAGSSTLDEATVRLARLTFRLLAGASS